MTDGIPFVGISAMEFPEEVLTEALESFGKFPQVVQCQKKGYPALQRLSIQAENQSQLVAQRQESLKELTSHRSHVQ